MRLDKKSTVEGYDPEQYEKLFDNLQGETEAEKINSLRREMYASRKLKNVDSEDIIETDRTVIQTRKLTEYLLKPGTKHSQEFFDVGYAENDFQQLAADIAAQYSEDKRVAFMTKDDGTQKFSVFAELGTTTRKTFQTVWQIDPGSKKPRLITCYRVSRKKGGEGE